MKETLKELYNDGYIDVTTLDIAVNKRWITEDEKQHILTSKQA